MKTERVNPLISFTMLKSITYIYECETKRNKRNDMLPFITILAFVTNGDSIILYVCSIPDMHSYKLHTFLNLPV